MYSRYLTEKDRDELKAAKEQGYLVSTCRKPDLYEAFMSYCKGAIINKPYVAAKVKQKYASVDLDLINTSWELTEQAQSDMRELLGSVGVRDIHVSSSGGLNEVPKERAEYVAQRLYEIAMDCKDYKPNSHLIVVI